VTALPQPKLFVSGGQKAAVVAADVGVPSEEVERILGALFGSSSWTSNQSELLILVTPTVFNPMSPPARSVLPIRPDTSLPARDAIEKRLPPLPPKKP